jgi:FecR protein
MHHRYLVREIILKHHRGEALTTEEQAILDAEMANLPADKVWERIRSHVEKRPAAVVRFRNARWAAAAAVVACIAVVVYRYDHASKVEEVLVWQTVAPGHFTAEVAGMVIDSADGGQSVPYPVTLPDGSKVTLCYQSSVRYAKTFVKRTVALLGQAYFKVAKSEAPFAVTSGRETVDVLGTEFNLMHYAGLPDEITLYSGKIVVEVGDLKKELQPGERAVIDKKMRVEKMDEPGRSVAWMDPDPSLQFNNTDLYTVIQRLAQYYQVGYSIDPSLRTGSPVTGTLYLQWKLDQNISRMNDILKYHAQVQFNHGMIVVTKSTLY